MQSAATSPSKTQLLDAALQVIRARGYAAATVDDICRQAGVTKGSFFHHFKSKDDLALAAVAHWEVMTEALFAQADYNRIADPLERLLGYLALRNGMLGGALVDYTCLMGTLVQETYDTHPAIRAACDRNMTRHVEHLAVHIEAARARYAPDAPWSAASVGYFIQALLQGSFIFAKAKQGPEVARQNLEHLRRYLLQLFNHSNRQEQ
jgi:TetR/AcrR family transcriptional repressor of nem operon